MQAPILTGLLPLLLAVLQVPSSAAPQASLTIRNTSLAVRGFSQEPNPRLSPPWLALYVNEGSQGQDLNGNGFVSLFESVAHVVDTRSGTAFNLGFGTGTLLISSWGFAGNTLFVPAYEPVDIEDYNGDGALNAWVLHAFDGKTGSVVNLGVNVRQFSSFVEDDVLAYLVPEAIDQIDRNGDGDTDDDVLRVARLGAARPFAGGAAPGVGVGLQQLYGEGPAASLLETSEDYLVATSSEASQGQDLNGDGDTLDSGLYAVDLRTRSLAPRSLGLAGQWEDIDGDSLRLQVFEWQQGGLDLNGDGDADDSVYFDHDIVTGIATQSPVQHPTTNLGDWLLFRLDERIEAQDLNGDGDQEDPSVPQLYHRLTGDVVNTGVASVDAELVGTTLFFSVDEADQGALDLNGDGDTGDMVIQALDLVGGALVNLGIAGFVRDADGLALAFLYEGQQGRDWNADGDRADLVLLVIDPARSSARLLQATNGFFLADAGRIAYPVFEADEAGIDRNGDGDATDVVLSLFDSTTGTAHSTGLAATYPTLANSNLRGGILSFPVSEEDQGESDLNGDGDPLDDVMHIATLP